jgi:hypothetical protein
MRSFLIITITLAACTDDPAPSASIEKVAPDALTASDDTTNDLTITLKYSDGDGDLGGGTAEVQDCRADDLATQIAIPAIAKAKGDHITGELEVILNDVGSVAAGTMPTACSDLGVAALAADQSVFCVVLIDAAGHRGTGSCTEAIAIAP